MLPVLTRLVLSYSPRKALLEDYQQVTPEVLQVMTKCFVISVAQLAAPNHQAKAPSASECKTQAIIRDKAGTDDERAHKRLL